MIDPNRACYQNSKVVYNYKNRDDLFKPEVMLLYKFEEKFKSWNMLDIGVGGGRTTRYFAHLMNSYIGIDYSEKMVEACQKNFPDLKFMQCDVRNMEIFEDSSFDLVFFSFNGIDSIAHNDRLKALHEIGRICKKPGGIFFFSSHNLKYIPYLFSFKFSMHPTATIFNLCNQILLRLKNMNTKYDNKYVIINDGAHHFRLSTYYITPEEQIAQLIDVGFKNIRTYHLNSGTEITDEKQNDRDPWIHYLCES